MLCIQTLCILKAMLSKVFSEKTDVWSFGVYCFEVASYGEVPFKHVSTDDVAQHLANGGSLEVPKACASGLADVMRECWRRNDHERPSFADIRDRAERMLASLAPPEWPGIPMDDLGQLIQFDDPAAAAAGAVHFDLPLPCLAV